MCARSGDFRIRNGFDPLCFHSGTICLTEYLVEATMWHSIKNTTTTQPRAHPAGRQVRKRKLPWWCGWCILCTGGLDVIRKEAWPFYRTSSGVRLCWVLEEPEGPK